MTAPKLNCPDGGTCHHGGCKDACFRVQHCEPLSGAYPGNTWPVHIRQNPRPGPSTVSPSERLYVELASIFAYLGAHVAPEERWSQGYHKSNGGVEVKLADHGVVRLDLASWGLRLRWELPNNIASVHGELRIESFLSDAWTTKSGVQWGARSAVTPSEAHTFSSDVDRSANAALYAEATLNWLMSLPSDAERTALMSETATLFASPGRSFRDAVVATAKLGH